MSDLYDALRALLFRLPPEASHALAMAWLGRHRTAPAAAPGPLARRVFGLEFSSPLGLAAGFDKGECRWPGLARLGFGFVELGTVTPRPQPGNPRPRLFRLPEHRALVNRMGFNNAGAEVVAERLARLGPAPIPLGVNVGKNRDTPASKAAEDFASAARTLAPYASYLAVNVSSPNTPGLRDLAAAEPLAEIVRGVVEAAAAKPVLVKLSPDMDDAALEAAAEASLAAGAAGFIATNTTVSRPVPSSEPGGLSGAPLGPLALARFTRLAHLVRGRAPLVGCGGIFSGGDARAYLDAGASLVQVYTAFIYRGPTVARDVERELVRSYAAPAP